MLPRFNGITKPEPGPGHKVGADGQRPPIREKLAKSLSMAREAGPFARGDHKRETDEMWDED